MDATTLSTTRTSSNVIANRPLRCGCFACRKHAQQAVSGALCRSTAKLPGYLRRPRLWKGKFATWRLGCLAVRSRFEQARRGNAAARRRVGRARPATAPLAPRAERALPTAELLRKGCPHIKDSATVTTRHPYSPVRPEPLRLAAVSTYPVGGSWTTTAIPCRSPQEWSLLRLVPSPSTACPPAPPQARLLRPTRRHRQRGDHRRRATAGRADLAPRRRACLDCRR